MNIFDFGLAKNLMHGRLRYRFWNSCADNPKSKIQNPKWPGIVALVITFAMSGAVGAQPTKVPLIGHLAVASHSSEVTRMEALNRGLRQLGYVEGKNIVIEWRFADGKLDRLPSLVAELMRLKVEIIVTAGSTPTRAAKTATSTIPIVMTNDNDPVGDGFVTSLARPGGNITGLSNFAPELNGKRLEILREVVPKLSRVAILRTSTNPGHGPIA